MEGGGFDAEARDRWRWTLFIVQPEIITPEWVAETAEEVARKKGLPAARNTRLETLHEGRYAQVMHIGPYSAEGPTVAALHAFIAEQGCRPRGKHHEIYLSDMRRVPEEKWRTIIRQPVESA